MAHFPVRRTLTTLLTRTFTQTQTRTSSLRSRLSLSFLQTHLLTPNPSQPIQTRTAGYTPLNDPSPNWTNRPPKETILLDGCDYEHWLIVMEFPDDPKRSDQDLVNSYVQTLAQIVGSEEEAKKRIYSISTTTYTGFGALISEELSYKVKALPGVLWVLPDSYLDVPKKDYGGDLFVDGKVIRRPEYDFSERQTNPRHRPRQDRRSRGRPTQIQDQTQSVQSSMNGQNAPQSQGGYPAVN